MLNAHSAHDANDWDIKVVEAYLQTLEVQPLNDSTVNRMAARFLRDHAISEPERALSTCTGPSPAPICTTPRTAFSCELPVLRYVTLLAIGVVTFIIYVQRLRAGSEPTGIRASGSNVIAPTVSSTAIRLSHQDDESLQSSAAIDAKKPAGTYYVRQGDTLSEISERYYGSMKHWPAIVHANPGLVPERMRAGSTIRLPALISMVAQ
jgi:phage tail protein X